MKALNANFTFVVQRRQQNGV